MMSRASFWPRRGSREMNAASRTPGTPCTAASDAIVERPPLFVGLEAPLGAVVRDRQPDLEREQPVGVEAVLHRHQSLEAPAACSPAPARSIRATATSATTSAARIRVRGAPELPRPESFSTPCRSAREAWSAGIRPKTDAGQQNEEGGEAQHRQRKLDLPGAREIQRHQSTERARAPGGEHEPETAAHDREHQALGEQLAARGGPGCFPARCGARSPARAPWRGRAAGWPRWRSRSAARSPRRRAGRGARAGRRPPPAPPAAWQPGATPGSSG